MIDKLRSIIFSYEDRQNKFSDPDIMSDPQKVKEYGQLLSLRKESYDIAKAYCKSRDEVEEANKILDIEEDKDMKDMAKEQLEKAKISLLPKDVNDGKNIYLELRPAAWWDESWIFAYELMRAYIVYAQNKWRNIDIVDEQMTEVGWLRFAMIKIIGQWAYSYLKRESWVHRVQRVPQTESQWRVHTSTVTVAVMPEVDDVTIDFNENDVKMDTFAASSAWWQNANKNQTWVRLNHEPSWIIVTMADSKSQLQNREKARNVLKAKLYQMEQEKLAEESRELRTDQIWWWKRSEKIRTYNYPQDRVTDHRIKESRSNIQWIMNWDFEDIINKLSIANQAQLLEAVMDSTIN